MQCINAFETDGLVYVNVTPTEWPVLLITTGDGSRFALHLDGNGIETGIQLGAEIERRCREVAGQLAMARAPRPSDDPMLPRDEEPPTEILRRDSA